MRHSLPEAFSLRWNRRVSVAEIEELVGESGDFDQRAFRCLCENCGAQVTLANWFTPETLRKQTRHFRSFHHTVDCAYLVYLRTGHNEGDEEQSHLIAHRHAPDRFDPAEDTREEIPSSPGSFRAVGTMSQGQGMVLRPEDKPLRCRYLAQLIRRYLRLTEAGVAGGRTVTVQGQVVEYEDLFQRIDGQEAQDQDQLPRIWHGPALLSSARGGYRVVFVDRLRWGRAAFPSALYIPVNWLDWYPKYPLAVLELFQKSQQTPMRVNAFALGDLKETRTDGKAFLNIKAYKRSAFWIEPL